MSTSDAAVAPGGSASGDTDAKYVPFDSGVAVAIVSLRPAAAVTGIVNVAVAVCAGAPWSVSVTVNDEVAPVSVPLMSPIGDNDNPAGRAPPVRAHENGPVPPVCRSVIWTFEPLTIGGRLEVDTR